jgi:hypothetical protein
MRWGLQGKKAVIVQVSPVSRYPLIGQVATCTRGMTRRQGVDGRPGLAIWRVAANRLNKQSRIANRGVVLEVGGELAGGHKLRTK